jgi:hypothetical protein
MYLLRFDCLFFVISSKGEGETMGYEAYNWRELTDKDVYSKQIQCTNTKGRPDIYINVEGIIKACDFKKKSQFFQIILIFFQIIPNLF